MKDSFGREIDYLRISITDRCNLRCRYCMPDGIRRISVKEILTFEEIELICKAAAEIGIRHVKITGGEPLARLGCPRLIGMIKKVPGIKQVTLTTNGTLLAKVLDELIENGLDAVNISLDTLDRAVYERITGADKLQRVKDGMQKAAEKGLHVKVNSVLQKGINTHEWTALAELARERPVDVRFIEMMPIGYGKKEAGVDGNELFSWIQEKYPGVEEDHSKHGNGPAIYYHIPGFAGSVGFISAVHGRFCGACNRIRLTAQGELKPCLCYEDCIDLKNILRVGERQKKEGPEKILAEIKAALQEAVRRKPQMHCFESEGRITESRQMVQIGG